jgi:hypothetical protein
MKLQSYRFRFRTGEIVIDHTKCAKCKTYACVKADGLFGTGVLRIQDRRPVLTTSLDDAPRLCNECLACEIYCQWYGKKALRIKLDTLAS